MKRLIQTLFGKADHSPSPETDPHVAAAALLVEAALVDGVYADSEQAEILSILQDAFAMEESRAQAVLDEAETLAEHAVDHFRFTKVVKSCLPETERVALVEHLFAVALADGHRSAIEESFVRRIAPLLAVDDRQRAFARSRAEAKVRGH
ncbi:TerB family tellurite resistance protein [Maricaulis sp. D1M11]|uniref:tellurite resistance TerB family protein n=1 Tax=Maricaulis sp. D1M11 TaxID=3076117 RepID=UPI0039B68638